MKNKRFIFGHPIRKDTTEEFFPDKISVNAFCKLIRENLTPFKDNMTSLTMTSLKYPEEWLETFCAWSELEPNWKDVEATKELVYDSKS